MKTGYEAARTQAGAISAAVAAVAGSAGFIAGALVMGLLAFSQESQPSTSQALSAPASNRASPDAPQPSVFYQTPDGPAVPWPEPWGFERAPAKQAGAPGAKRADRLSAPEGWTQQGVVQNDEPGTGP
jgi:hypothetical protein